MPDETRPRAHANATTKHSSAHANWLFVTLVTPSSPQRHTYVCATPPIEMAHSTAPASKPLRGPVMADMMPLPCVTVTTPHSVRNDGVSPSADERMCATRCGDPHRVNSWDPSTTRRR